MTLVDHPISDLLLDLARRAADPISSRACGVRVLSAPGVPLPDSAGKYLLIDASGQPIAFAHASPREAPDAVARDALNASRAREQLGHVLGDCVLTPIAFGYGRGTSIAVYPLCDPLAATRLRWQLQRLSVRGWAFEWLRAVATRTLRPVKDSLEQKARFERPLEALISLGELETTIHRDALAALDRLRSGTWTPRLGLMHGDFWRGNILVRRASESPSRRRTAQYVVTDWGTCEVDGYPIFDLVRLAHSLGVRGRRLRPELARHLEVMECSPLEARCYLLAALGHRALNLECFPIENFLRMSASCHSILAEVT